LAGWEVTVPGQQLKGYGAETYGEQIADVYDDLYTGGAFDPAPAVAFLTALAGRGSALELGIGTGRVALPLSKRGVAVRGIDASPAMVARLRKKAGGQAIRVAIGDFKDVDVPGRYDLVFVVFNTLFGLVTQEAQVECFQNVSRKLKPGGAFVIQAFVPDLTRVQRGQAVVASRVDSDRVIIDASRHDTASQTVTSQHVWITEAGNRLFPVRLRYAYPSELDLMARLAGMRLRERIADWKRTPFDSSSQQHVSVYELAADSA
jgi:SAM-dependent methyltransferase